MSNFDKTSMNWLINFSFYLSNEIRVQIVYEKHHSLCEIAIRKHRIEYLICQLEFTISKYLFSFNSNGHFSLANRLFTELSELGVISWGFTIKSFLVFPICLPQYLLQVLNASRTRKEAFAVTLIVVYQRLHQEFQRGYAALGTITHTPHSS